MVGQAKRRQLSMEDGNVDDNGGDMTSKLQIHVWPL